MVWGYRRNWLSGRDETRCSAIAPMQAAGKGGSDGETTRSDDNSNRNSFGYSRPWDMPPDISRHGALIDKQMSETNYQI
jgi:hypothetical protein